MIDGVDVGYRESKGSPPRIIERHTDGVKSLAAGIDLKEEIAVPLRKRDPKVAETDLYPCDNFDVRDRLSEMEVPTLMIFGPEDVLIP